MTVVVRKGRMWYNVGEVKEMLIGSMVDELYGWYVVDGDVERRIVCIRFDNIPGFNEGVMDECKKYPKYVNERMMYHVERLSRENFDIPDDARLVDVRMIREGSDATRREPTGEKRYYAYFAHASFAPTCDGDCYDIMDKRIG